MTMDLSALGLELDALRRARRDANPEPAALSTSPGSDTSDSLSLSPLSSPSTSPTTSSRVLENTPENPYPLCLLCLTRTPSAVLLPCAHLNLCHLCAPLLMHKSRPCEAGAPGAPRAPVPAPAADPHRDGRVPYNVALSRALGGTSRRGAGGYLPPREGVRGGEMRGRDLLDTAEGSGLARASAGGGQVLLSLEGPQAAQCLVCRRGVSGWLRVYTG